MRNVRTIFISGPYRGQNEIDVHDNISRAHSASAKLWRKGYWVFCPHLNTAYMGGVTSDQNILTFCLSMLETCDAILMLNGWQDSPGAQAEYLYALFLGLTVLFEKDLNIIDNCKHKLYSGKEQAYKKFINAGKDSGLTVEDRYKLLTKEL